MAGTGHVFVVEDERDIATLIVHYLVREGYRAETVADGRTALARIEKSPPDLVILDLMLPGVDGLEICRRLRRNESTAAVPIIMLTAKGDETDKIVGLELGADDYLTKPFSPKELMARVKALLRRAKREEPAETKIQYGRLTLDSSRHQVMDGRKEIHLTAKEFGLLESFLRSQGRVLTRDHLLNTVWGYDFPGTTRTVDVHVRHLREKIPMLAEMIVTIKNIGYKLRDDL
ncbi:MAG: response regulator transcription factor [candidate division Zixibacteria bacterium]|nr:response regulator transcription factor [candidate division Zixibacteria bacterium]